MCIRDRGRGRRSEEESPALLSRGLCVCASSNCTEENFYTVMFGVGRAIGVLPMLTIRSHPILPRALSRSRSPVVRVLSSCSSSRAAARSLAHRHQHACVFSPHMSV
eukprot:3877921-Rhodomonas_salina.1